MASERRRAWPFALRLTARGALAGGLLVAAALLLWWGKPISALLALALAGATGLDLLRVARQAERAMEDLVEQLAIGVDDGPPRLDPAFHALDAGIARALAAMRAERIGQAERTGALEALLDTVPAALFVTDGDGAIVLANRPARALAPAAASHLGQNPVFLADDAAALVSAPPGSKRLLRLVDGRSALAGVALFVLADGTRRRLVSVQIVAEQLTPVEANAWHHLSRVLAHEMMNSLSPVVSIAESLAALFDHPDERLDRREIAVSLALMARRAGHLMNFVERYRATLDMPEAVLRPVAMREFAADLVRIGEEWASHASIQVRVEPQDLVVELDRELMEQALINLLKNAIQAVEQTADPTIELHIHAKDGATSIEIVDNGSGLAADSDTLFLPFYTTKPGGSGIGLSVARQIAHAHGGTLIAKPMPEGAMFAMTLPSRGSPAMPVIQA